MFCKRIENKDLNSIDFVHEKENTLVFRTKVEEKPKLILQIGSNSPEIAVKAVKVFENDIYGVDVNMGCQMKFST